MSLQVQDGLHVTRRYLAANATDPQSKPDPGEISGHKYPPLQWIKSQGHFGSREKADPQNALQLTDLAENLPTRLPP
jgi:hypothetical protein